MGTTHASEDTIEQYIRHQLPEPKLSLFEEHLLHCERCQDAVVVEEEFVTNLRRALARPDAHRTSIFHNPFPTVRGLWLIPALAFLLLCFIEAPRQEPAAQQIALAALRGTSPAEKALSGMPLLLLLDATSLPAHEEVLITVVNSTGALEQSAKATPSANELRFHARPLAAGQYWVRILRGDEVMREFSLRVRDP